jgi:hypothetical protein
MKAYAVSQLKTGAASSALRDLIVVSTGGFLLKSIADFRGESKI